MCVIKKLEELNKQKGTGIKWQIEPFTVQNNTGHDNIQIFILDKKINSFKFFLQQFRSTTLTIKFTD